MFSFLQQVVVLSTELQESMVVAKLFLSQIKDVWDDEEPSHQARKEAESEQRSKSNNGQSTEESSASTVSTTEPAQLDNGE